MKATGADFQPQSCAAVTLLPSCSDSSRIPPSLRAYSPVCLHAQLNPTVLLDTPQPPQELYSGCSCCLLLLYQGLFSADFSDHWLKPSTPLFFLSVFHPVSLDA